MLTPYCCATTNRLSSSLCTSLHLFSCFWDAQNLFIISWWDIHDHSFQWKRCFDVAWKMPAVERRSFDPQFGVIPKRKQNKATSEVLHDPSSRRSPREVRGVRIPRLRPVSGQVVLFTTHIQWKNVGLLVQNLGQEFQDVTRHGMVWRLGVQHAH